MSRAESKAMTIAKKVALFLKSKYGATRVMLFGSLAKGFFDKGSDIDIYCEGIPKGDVLEAHAECTRVFRQHEIDLIPDLFCHDRLRQRILKEGIVL